MPKRFAAPHLALVLLLFAAMALAFLAVGCASKQEEPKPKPKQIVLPEELKPPNQVVLNLLARSRVLLELGSPLQAREVALKAMSAATRPNGKARCKLELARIDLAREQYADANRWLLQVYEMPRSLTKYKLGALAVEADWLQAKSFQARAETSQARQALTRLVKRPEMDITINQQQASQDFLYRDLGRPAAELELTKLLLYRARAGASWANRQLTPLVGRAAAGAPVPGLEELVRSEPETRLKAALLSGLEVGYLRESRPEAAKQTMAYLANLPQGPVYMPYNVAVKSLMVEAAKVEAMNVGAVLPLTGPRAAEGNRVLAALKLALKGEGSGPQPELIVIDGGSDAAISDQAVNTLVDRDKVAAIVGPLAPVAAMAAAKRAQELHTPIFLLSPDAKLAEVGDCVFRNFFTTEDQIKAVMKIAVKTGTRRFNVMAPAGAKGREFSILLAEWVKRSATGEGDLYKVGYQNVSMGSPVYYPPDMKNLDAVIKQLVGLPPGPWRPNQPGGARPVIKFDRLWTPGPATQIPLLADRLAYYDVKGDMLIGTYDWHNPAFLSHIGSRINGCLFPDSFDPNSSERAVAEFVEAYRGMTGALPETLEAHAYDTGRIIRGVVVGRASMLSRARVRSELNKLKGFEGVCGRLGMGPERRVRGKLKVFTVREGQAHEVDPANL